jgi:hypothetical protein
MLLLAALAMAHLSAQPAQDLLLPESRHIFGIVVDSSGSPIPDAAVVYTGGPRVDTNAEGRFELDTRAPQFIIVKPGYRGALVRTETTDAPRITLQRLKETMVFPTCPTTAGRVGLKWGNARLLFPKIRGMIAGPEGRGDHCSWRTYSIKPGQGPPVIGHIQGVQMGGGPSDREIWRSRTYEDIDYTVGDEVVFDIRGEFANGNRWRCLGRFLESACYSDVDPAAAKIFDRFLDGACLAPAR